MTVNEKGLEAALLPCPFCGYPASESDGLCVIDTDEFGEKTDSVSYAGVSCAGCAALVPINTINKAEAIAAWNRRAASNDAEPVAWTSSGNLDGLRDHDSLVIGSMCNRQGDGWTVPLYLTAIEPVAASPDVMREARGALAIALSAIEKAGDDLQASGAYPVGALAALIVPAEQVRTAITNIDRALSSKQRSGE